MFGDKVRQMFNKEPKQDDVIIEQPTARTTAEDALIAELSTLTTAGSGFVQPAPPAPVIDIGIWDPPSQPVQAPAIALHESPEAKRIVAFVRACSAAVTHREICGGTGLHFDVVRELLPALVAACVLRITEGSENFAQYVLATATPKPTPVHEPYIHPETAWSNAARARELAKEAAKRPAPEPRREITDAEVDAVIAADDAKQTTIVLTAEERRWLDEARTRRPVNPQAFLR